MMYLGDYPEDSTLDFMWSSNDADGGSVTRATNGTISVYKGNSTTQSTAGVTDTEDFDSLTGIHHVRIDLSADAFYATGADYMVVLSGATIDGETVNAVLAHFSIQNRYMRGTDSANTTTPPTAAAVADAVWDEDITTHTTTDSAGEALADAQAGGGGGPSAAAIADAVWDEALSGHGSGGTAGKVLADINPPTASTIADAVWDESLSGHSGGGTAGEALAATYTGTPPTVNAIADAVWDEALSGHSSPGTAGDALQDAAVANTLTASDIADAVWDEDITTHTDPDSAGESLQTAAAVSPPSAASIADAVWDEDLTGHTTTDSTGEALNTAATATAATAADIADAVWDEDLAAHSTPGTAGKALTDAVGGASGVGAITFVYTLTSTADSSPIEDADVWATSNADGTGLLASGRTDNNGQVTFYLDAGTVYIWRQKKGWNFTNPDEEVVA